MSEFKFFHPLELRFSDLDVYWHVNNARFATFLEEARVAYLVHLGLWDGMTFLSLGIIVAELHIRYIAPIEIHQKVRVGVRIAQIGNKSLTFHYRIEDAQNGALLATAESVGVGYEYHSKTTVPIRDEWRKTIGAFEGLDFSLKH